MVTEVILPRVDMDMAEGKIALWYVKNGDTVTKGQVLFEIETDKATMEVESTAHGVIDSIHAELGVAIPVGQVVAWIRAPGEAAAHADMAPAAAASGQGAALAPASSDAATAAKPATTVDTGRRAADVTPNDRTALLRATPLARSLARERGIDLNALSGSGPHGRILGCDVPNTQSTREADGSGPSLHLHWWQRGNGLPVLLLHGFGADHGSWRPLAQQLPSQLPLVGIDLPHHGKSPALPVESLKNIAEAVGRRLDQEGITACHVLGHSLGGGVALALAAAQPERVRSLTLLAPAGLGAEIDRGFIEGLTRADTEASLKATLSALFHDSAALTGSFVATAFQQLQAPGRQAALSALAGELMPEGQQAESLRETLEALRVPVKLIWGVADRIVPASHATGVSGRVALHLIPNVGHLPQIEAVSLVAELLVEQVRAGTAS
ncbi:acetoin dehydrogenase dihydrolipoyllysine-residue acetyltransferase subunit [Variovorax ginsengisoli]|uniref:Pyruvate dehydrogenase E2 component (Dihydrolipoamide acetyltransferase) n=1 Tax=Variovorax ginsengisoli TaxID=363844 RepID=A0ABT9S4N6_9BURK|nr:acetoin dehydrogenase dihydrolipoyllysine-residue acetyltransferase subunit [Variovorax ginsengisoli]MDP9898833.1 pyruvate dehydrogenase E2 component (dihydrolipoamide acetyltransferase) [Variovorax ginsengisoli]